MLKSLEARILALLNRFDKTNPPRLPLVVAELEVPLVMAELMDTGPCKSPPPSAPIVEARVTNNNEGPGSALSLGRRFDVDVGSEAGESHLITRTNVSV